MSFPCRVKADLNIYERAQDEQYANGALPDFRQVDDCKAASDPEMAVPLSQLMEARHQYMATSRKEIKEQLAMDMLKAISGLERVLLARWLEL